MKYGVCKYYRGPIIHETCQVGIDYGTLANRGDIGWMLKLPCFAKHDTKATCGKREFPTEEELVEYERWSQERAMMSAEAYGRCAEHALANGFVRGEKGVNGEVVCPLCHGKLKYSIAASNGHIWAKCSTKDCLCWMQ